MRLAACVKFAEELERMLASRGMTQAQFAGAIGVSQTQVSRWLSGTNHPERSMFGSVCRALSADPADHARLLAGRLISQLDLPGGELVQVSVANTTTSALSDAPRPTTALERAEHYLHTEARRRIDVRELVIDLAKCLGHGTADLVDAVVAEAAKDAGGYRRGKRAGGAQRPQAAQGSGPSAHAGNGANG